MNDARARWNALPPKPCPACERVLSRKHFPTSGGKCYACQRAHRIEKGTDTSSAQDRGPKRIGRPPAREGTDYTQLAQDRLFPGLKYTQLTRDECLAVRTVALELLAKATNPTPADAEAAA